VRTRLRQEGGFGLIELLMAMTILNIGILTLVAAFNSGSVALRRSSMISTASVLADKQIELYRALTYDAIALDPSTVPTTTPYTSDAAYSTPQATRTCSGSPLPPECNASRTLTGPDHHTYRIDTYIIDDHASGTSGRALRRVTVVIRDGSNLNKKLASETTTFDCSTALPNASGCPST
jgi:Tfp pilus assembly protein PilV